MASILIVDDEPGVRTLYSTVLTCEGHQVSIADNCTEAGRILKSEEIDLVVLDIQIKQESGLDMLQSIINSHPGLPVILCSAHSYYKSDYSSWLADAYIVKNSDLSEFKTDIKRLLNRNKPTH